MQEATRTAELEAELKKMIVEVLRLEDIQPEEIGSNDALFGGSLGLTSIDALELAMALGKRYQIVLDPDNEQNKRAFESVGALASYIQANRPRA